MHSVSTFPKLWARLNGNFDPPVRRYKLFCWERLMLCSNIFSWTPLNVNQSPRAVVGRLVIRWGGTHWFLILTCKFVCHPICTVSWPACILLSTSQHHRILLFQSEWLVYFPGKLCGSTVRMSSVVSVLCFFRFAKRISRLVWLDLIS